MAVRKSVRARKIGMSLFASYPSASPPLVWKFDLEKNHSFTLALQGEEGDWELGMTSPKGEFYPVAHFLVREDADEAFARTQKALMAPQHDRLYDNLWNLWGRISMVILCILIACLLLNVLFSNGISKGPPPLSDSTRNEAPARLKEGVPLPADQVLRPPS